ncbi:DMT family transporter [Zeaxanthinibacter sp. PT1]|uniref:DMT family transporter n=1 Tax=Zeaxanthinibacter TaxID=561554 RepID=UPI0023497C1E|nr:DMT family transporter [Zeaxanthinibacter sp. PT1]MDC6351078.1 DMT family transporter [Zeaxanthinibacter sp. PT1]
MSDVNRRWFYLVVLSIIWGTSYILIKKGLQGFSPIQLGSVRMVITAAFLLLFGYRSVRKIKKNEWKWVALSGFVGSFFPAFLFAFAETEIDSSIASVLNSLVPLFTIFVGYIVFKIPFYKNQVVGVIIGLVGAAMLVGIGADINPGQNYWYAGLVILATLFYALNANIIKSKLSGVSPIGIAAGNFAAVLLPSLVVLAFSGAFSEEVTGGEYYYSSLVYVVILSVVGTCFAKVMFNKLVHISSPVFSVSVTYLIPIVGVIWGLLDGERFSLWQLAAAAIILFGVYLVNRRKVNR